MTSENKTYKLMRKALKAEILTGSDKKLRATLNELVVTHDDDKAFADILEWHTAQLAQREKEFAAEKAEFGLSVSESVRAMVEAEWNKWAVEANQEHLDKVKKALAQQRAEIAREIFEAIDHYEEDIADGRSSRVLIGYFDYRALKARFQQKG